MKLTIIFSSLILINLLILLYLVQKPVSVRFFVILCTMLIGLSTTTIATLISAFEEILNIIQQNDIQTLTIFLWGYIMAWIRISIIGYNSMKGMLQQKIPVDYISLLKNSKFKKVMEKLYKISVTWCSFIRHTPWLCHGEPSIVKAGLMALYKWKHTKYVITGASCVSMGTITLLTNHDPIKAMLATCLISILIIKILKVVEALGTSPWNQNVCKADYLSLNWNEPRYPLTFWTFFPAQIKEHGLPHFEDADQDEKVAELNAYSVQNAREYLNQQDRLHMLAYRNIRSPYTNFHKRIKANYQVWAHIRWMSTTTTREAAKNWHPMTSLLARNTPFTTIPRRTQHLNTVFKDGQKCSVHTKVSIHKALNLLLPHFNPRKVSGIAGFSKNFLMQLSDPHSIQGQFYKRQLIFNMLMNLNNLLGRSLIQSQSDLSERIINSTKTYYIGSPDPEKNPLVRTTFYAQHANALLFANAPFQTDLLSHASKIPLDVSGYPYGVLAQNLFEISHLNSYLEDIKPQLPDNINMKGVVINPDNIQAHQTHIANLSYSIMKQPNPDFLLKFFILIDNGLKTKEIPADVKTSIHDLIKTLALHKGLIGIAPQADPYFLGQRFAGDLGTYLSQKQSLLDPEEAHTLYQYWKKILVNKKDTQTYGQTYKQTRVDLFLNLGVNTVAPSIIAQAKIDLILDDLIQRMEQETGKKFQDIIANMARDIDVLPWLPENQMVSREAQIGLLKDLLPYFPEGDKLLMMENLWRFVKYTILPPI